MVVLSTFSNLVGLLTQPADDLCHSFRFGVLMCNTAVCEERLRELRQSALLNGKYTSTPGETDHDQQLFVSNVWIGSPQQFQLLVLCLSE